MRSLLVPCLEALDRGEAVLLATVVSVRGSAPSRTSNALLRLRDGSFVGTVGGGALEAEALRILGSLTGDSQPSVREHRLDPAGGLDLVCGGVERIRYEHIVAGSASDRALRAANESRVKRRRGWLVVDARIGDGLAPIRWVGEGGRDPDDLVFTVREQAARRPRTIDLGAQTYFIEPILEDGLLHVVGAGHVGREVADLAASCDFDVLLYDDRDEWLEGAEVPSSVTKVSLETLDSSLEGRFHPSDRVVAVHRSHRGDEEIVAAALMAGTSYVGMIGSRAKRHAVLERLGLRGYPEASLARIHSPIGLPIHATSPREIAVSIVAELIAHRNRPETSA